MNTIQDKWDYFEQRYVTEEVSEAERARIKAGFYGGAAALLDFMVEVSSGEISEEAGAGIMAGLHEELLLYVGEKEDDEENLDG
jgi:hypothetical protein